LEFWSLFNAFSLKQLPNSRKLLHWAVLFTLVIALIYFLFFSASSLGFSFFILSNRGMIQISISNVLLSAHADGLVWGSLILVVLAWLISSLFLKPFKSVEKLVFGSVLTAFVVAECLGLLGGLPLLWDNAVLTGALACMCIFFSKRFFDYSKISMFKRLLLCLFLLSVFVEAATLFLVNVPVAVNLSSALSGSVAHLRIVEMSFSNLFYPFLTYAYLFLIFLGIFIYAVKVLPLKRLSDKFKPKQLIDSSAWLKNFSERYFTLENQPLGTRFPLILAVAVSIVVSVLFVVFTVLPWANPTNMLVSVDSPGYYQWIVQMRSQNVGSALSFALTNDRAAFLVLGYILSFIIGPVEAIQFASALLIPLFVVVSCLFLRVFSGFKDVRVYGVLLVPFSFQALGLIYSGYFANMLALIFVFAYFVVFFKVLRSESSFWFFSLLVTSELILFSHSWTWFVFALSLGAFLVIELRSARKSDRNLWGRFKLKATLIGATLLLGFTTDFARKLLSPVSSSGSVIGVAQSSLGFPNPGYILSGLRETVNFILGGVFANSLLVFLCIVGLLLLLNFKSEASNLVISWLFVASVSILFASEDFVFNRFLFLLPTIMLSSLGLSFLVRFISADFYASKMWKRTVEGLILVFVFLALLNIALSYLFNINMW
jgi:hypothetical protein